MAVTSINFMLLLAASLILYYIIPLKIRWTVLLAASVFFFVSNGGITLFAMMCGMAALSYIAALIIGRLGENKAKTRAFISFLAIFINILLLIIFKENSFFVNNINALSRLLHFDFKIAMPAWVAPLGMSYYTLILIGYILDVTWKSIAPQRNPAKLLLFTSFFPQMTSGPFTRYGEVNNELFSGHRFDYENFCFGLQRIMWGFFKKLVIAERLSVIVATIFGDYDTYSGIYVFIAIIFYTLQVYADFSGYIDIVLGVAQLFGVKLPENFDTPFYSTSLSEVWRRWHMTLGLWVKNYVLYPVLKSRFLQSIGEKSKKKLGKKRGKRVPTYIGMLVTWLTVGFWHGGTWKYIFGSGLFFFIMIVSGMLLEPVFKWMIKILRINTEVFSWKIFQRIRTFLLFAFSVSFGRAASLLAGFKMIKSGFTTWNPWILFDESLYGLGLDRKDFHVLIIGLLVFFVASYLQQRGSIRAMLARQNLVFRWIVLLALLFGIIIFGQYGPGYDAASFIYGGF